MSTDVFNNFYDNPRKQAIYANMVCPGASSLNETKFSINDGAAEISNNNEVLGTLDLSKIASTGISNWNKQSKIIKGKSLLYLNNDAKGESYKTVAFGNLPYNIFDNNEAILHICLQFLKNDCIPCTEMIDVMGNSYDDILLELNNKLQNTYIDAHIDNNLLYFSSNNIGSDFYIDDIYIKYTDMNNSSHVKYLEEDISKYVPSYKYNNGAFKGVIINVEYPKYDNNIDSSHKSLKYVHISDRVNMYEKNDECLDDCYNKHIFDVYGNLTLSEEYNNCLIFNDKNYSEEDLNDNWINDDEYVIIYNNMKIKKRHILGLYGFCNYATCNNLWRNFGELYAIVASDDAENENVKNLIPSLVIYNPNDFEIKLNILSWE